MIITYKICKLDLRVCKLSYHKWKRSGQIWTGLIFSMKTNKLASLLMLCLTNIRHISERVPEYAN